MTKTKLVGMVVAAAAIAGVWHHRGSDATTEDASIDASMDDRALVFDRIWIDHMPKNETDKVQVFLVIDEAEAGVFQEASMWTGRYELFQFERGERGNLRATYPQTGERERLAVAAKTCHEVDKMDYCLAIKGSSRGVARYYSAKGWEIGEHTLVGALAQVAQTLEHAATPAP